ncbi:hypothetical protein [Enterococcus nangangensis]|uniref:hypothetical protein n=1 Tax=Enterococcus nangangensis TaxID=2559926 RepID=UPI0010F836C6|nr:hypothetical protein [Enterococcus nangangensis]
MSEAVTELVKLLNMNEGKKIRANHNLNGNRLFPFHTRNPERVKFTDNFDEIVGIIARCSLNKKAILDDFSEEHIDKIKQKLQTTVSENEIKRLFSIDFDTVRIPLLIQYIPVLKNNKTQIDESRGKKLLGRYITKLLRLDKNEKWKEFINTKFESDLYEKIYVDCLPEIEQDFNDEAEKRFVFFDQEEIVAKFNNDLEQLISNSHFSIDKLSLLISYYFFYYVNQQTYNLLNDKRKQKKMFF